MASSRLRVCAGVRSLSNKIDVGIRRSGQLLQFVDLALAQIGRHVGGLAALGKLAHHARTGRGRQALEFLERGFVLRLIGKENSYENRRLAGDGLDAVHFFHGWLVTSRLWVLTAEPFYARPPHGRPLLSRDAGHRPYGWVRRMVQFFPPASPVCKLQKLS